jgi:hypothetical protein
MKVYNAIGTILTFRGKVKHKELIGSFSTLENARSEVSRVASKYDETEIVTVELDLVEMKVV